MRPTKLTPKLLHALQSVLTDEFAVIAFTEEELVWQANQKLPLEERITYRTFQRYKAVVMSAETGDELTTSEYTEQPIAPETDAANTELVREMHTTIKSALFQQKLAMVKGVYAQLPNWRRYCWLLERKFPDFRLKQIVQAKPPQPLVSSAPLKPNDIAKSVDPVVSQKIPAEPPKPNQLGTIIADLAAKKAAEAAQQQANMPKTVEEKWQQRNHLPWKPMPLGTKVEFPVNKMYALDRELKADIAAGYINPYAHLEYRPDAVEYVQGFYRCFGMGEGKLPLRVHILNQSEAPEPDQLEALWHEQERVRNNIILWEQGLPQIPRPEDPNAPHLRAQIFGHSG